ncbi:class I SAM-dependent methyltransferase [Rhodopirellula sallentina]|uniref:Methyltransferase type 11 domain protein n=1 Tax=Rhodopirellula sallentina SM41 TaxID=1263870 RepID=M5TVR5_9BACT|nr:class I SAM-dependent methyltransferase [Rhodopirellula sallentina]EMI53255.1 Methyltransferase type 11 domain protein [Rhodopirellula sallentina SM41]
MPSALQLIPLVINQSLGPQILNRTPEPDHQVVTDKQNSVSEYDQVMKTKLAISYAVATEAIYRTRLRSISSALDIACGPGHLSINMARDLEIDELTGIDLSKTMIETASANARSQEIGSVRFQQGDATQLKFQDSTFDLCTMMDAIHHLPSLDVVSKSLNEMERVTKPDGHIVVMDLVRLRTRELTERYVKLVGSEYADLGLKDFYDQFQDSMHAAWTPDELASTVPADSHRNWIQIVPRGLPFAQFLFGLPVGQNDVFQRAGSPWKTPPVRLEDISEYRLASMGIHLGTKKRIMPASRASSCPVQ